MKNTCRVEDLTMRDSSGMRIPYDDEARHVASSKGDWANSEGVEYDSTRSEGTAKAGGLAGDCDSEVSWTMNAVKSKTRCAGHIWRSEPLAEGWPVPKNINCLWDEWTISKGVEYDSTRSEGTAKAEGMAGLSRWHTGCWPKRQYYSLDCAEGSDSNGHRKREPRSGCGSAPYYLDFMLQC